MDFVCDPKNCPPGIDDQEARCCRVCRLGHSYHVNDNNRHLWSETFGFWSRDGCRLSREDMPKRCREYDCRQYEHVYTTRWCGNMGWVSEYQFEMLPGHDLVKLERK